MCIAGVAMSVFSGALIKRIIKFETENSLGRLYLICMFMFVLFCYCFLFANFNVLIPSLGVRLRGLIWKICINCTNRYLLYLDGFNDI